MEHWYRAHGLVICSEVELGLPTGALAAATPDLILRCGAERAIPVEDPPGSRLATLTGRDGTVRYSLARDREQTVLRYPGLCEFVGDPELADVTVHRHPGRDSGLIPILAAGALVAVHLKLRHELVLHASAVQRNGQALAFVGASGMGKSTLAALLCSNGCELVTDDVLRVDLTAPVARVDPGGIESRLRVNARPLADAAPSGAVRRTADGRLALRPRACANEPLPLAACVVPLPTRKSVDVAVRRLRTAPALLRMLQFPRIVGWSEPISTADEFQALADLVERIPVFEASVPWGPPFRPQVASGLLEAIVGVGADQR